jgi:uncharacterized membrane protein
MLVLSYLGILSLIPYLMKKDDPDAELRWHAKNGVGLFILDIVVGVVFWILGMVADQVLTGLGCGIGLINCIVWLGLFGLHIFCIVKAVGGQRVTIPVVTDFAQKNL